MKSHLTRRGFLGAALTGAAGMGLQARAASRPAARTASGATPALLGGRPVRTAPFPSWPKVADRDEKSWTEVLHRGLWCRIDGSYATRFEEAWARTLGAKYCLATASGTTALLTSLNALDIGPGDEVLVPPYTFVATVNVVLLQHALPVFVDTDPETSQMDATKIEAAITDRTKCILPVHLGGSPADLDKILAIGRRHKLPVLEDACQAHLAEWRRRKVSTLGDLGCFSFQASKNLNSGEGGAVLTDNEDLMEACRSFHNNGRGAAGPGFSYVRNGCNHRMTEFQAALLLEQLSRLEEQSRVREQNAEYLTKQLREIPGIAPARMYEGATRNAYHLYMLRYESQKFAGLPRAQFLRAMQAEGIPCSGGYSPLNKEPFLKNTLQSRSYRSIYSAKEISDYEARNHCPANDKLCEEAVWFFQTMLLGSKSDMDQIAEAVRKIQTHAAALAKS
ncbi:MAG: DegT/DnrJ/EryC1/StrS family aminotransferase [Acidobacteria bacterium]|nr:DegT/DnrJ/EryC1/StrS family aminotransferase [Acidobacteriota bacterium]